MKLPESFFRATKVWRAKPEDKGTKAKKHGYHAMVVIGYDDNYEGGAFRLLNSWGTAWGDGGYIWVPYADYEEWAMGALQPYSYFKKKEEKKPEVKPEVKPTQNQQPMNPPLKQEVKPTQGPHPMNPPPPKQEVKPQEKVLADVPPAFQPKAGTAYQIKSLLDENKCLTVSNDKKLHINSYKG